MFSIDVIVIGKVIAVVVVVVVFLLATSRLFISPTDKPPTNIKSDTQHSEKKQK